MRRPRTALLVTVTAVAALAVVEPARADRPAGVYCGLAAFRSEAVGQAMEGTASGGPISHVGDISTTVRCYVTVDGVEVSSTPTGVAASAGPVSYSASDTSEIHICTEVTYSHGTETTCDGVTTIYLPDGTGRRSSHRGQAHTGGHKNKNPMTAPFRPSGTIEISSSPLGIVNYSFTGFNPPFPSWTCTPGSGPSITCAPPPPPPGHHNLCANVGVATTSMVPGTAYGTSACATPPNATSSSTGPSSTPAQASASPNTVFPWTCAATPAQTFVWTVRCSVG